jgi:hypothetical protein
MKRALEQFGGIATRRELIAAGWAKEYIDMAVYYRTMIIPRRGWYALPGTPEVVIRAIRVGGRLACVSALAYHRGEEVESPLHLVVPKSASRLRTGGEPGLVLHWSRRHLEGDRVAVSESVADRQARNCAQRASLTRCT